MIMIKVRGQAINPLQVSRIVIGGHGAYPDEVSLIMADGGTVQIAGKPDDVIELVEQAANTPAYKITLAELETNVGKGLADG